MGPGRPDTGRAFSTGRTPRLVKDRAATLNVPRGDTLGTESVVKTPKATPRYVQTCLRTCAGNTDTNGLDFMMATPAEPLIPSVLELLRL